MIKIPFRSVPSSMEGLRREAIEQHNGPLMQTHNRAPSSAKFGANKYLCSVQPSAALVNNSPLLFFHFRQCFMKCSVMFCVFHVMFCATFSRTHNSPLLPNL